MMENNREKPDFLLDGHVHTLECGHAYNTITEMARAAKERGLELICWTEHGPKMKGCPYPGFFRNMRIISPEIEGVRVLRGIEANILDTDGNVDVYDNFAPFMEVVSASLHTNTFKPRSKEENTQAVINAIKNDKVDFICHLGNPTYPIDQEAVVKAAKEYGKMIEINNASFSIRKGSLDNCLNIAELCKKYEVPVIVGTDAHWSGAVGDFKFAKMALEEVDFPDELVINYNPQRLLDYLESRGRNLGKVASDEAEELFKKRREKLEEKQEKE